MGIIAGTHDPRCGAERHAKFARLNPTARGHAASDVDVARRERVTERAPIEGVQRGIGGRAQGNDLAT